MELLHYISFLDTTSKKRFSNKIHNQILRFPLLLSLLIDDENYWERSCYSRNWRIVHYWFYSCSWKNTYISLFTEELIHDFLCAKSSFSELEISLLHLKDSVSILKINGYKFKYYQDNSSNPETENENVLEDNIARLLSYFRNLNELHLNNIPINYELTMDMKKNGNTDQSVDNLFKSLSNLHTLRKVLMIGSYMTKSLMQRFLTSLKPLCNLVELNLACNFITDELCPLIAEFLVSSKIEKLVLSRNNIGNIGCCHLAKMIPGSALKYVFLGHNLIGDEGITILFSSLLSRINFLKLDVSYNDITEKSTEVLCELILKHSTLKYLNISGNQLGKDAGPKLCRAFERKHPIKFFGCTYCGLQEQDEDMICCQVNHHYDHV